MLLTQVRRMFPTRVCRISLETLAASLVRPTGAELAGGHPSPPDAPSRPGALPVVPWSRSGLWVEASRGCPRQLSGLPPLSASSRLSSARLAQHAGAARPGEGSCGCGLPYVTHPARARGGKR